MMSLNELNTPPVEKEKRKQITMIASPQTRRMIAQLADYLGLPPKHHNSAVIAECIKRVYGDIFEEGEL